MSDFTAVISLLKDKITVNTYTGQIPETQSEPSVLLQELSNNFARTTEGVKINKISHWRITVVASLPSDVELLISKLDDLDNTVSVDFQRILTNLVMREPGLNEQPFRRAFYDLTVYTR